MGYISLCIVLAFVCCECRCIVCRYLTELILILIFLMMIVVVDGYL